MDNLQRNLLIKKLYLSGLSLSLVGKEVGLEQTQIRRILKSLGVDRRTQSETKKILYRRGLLTPGNKGHRIPIDIKYIEKMYEEGNSLSVISEMVGVDRMTVYNRMKENNLKLRKNNEISDLTREKLSLLRKGIPNPKQSIYMKLHNPMESEECKLGASKRASGENNYFWNGGMNMKYKNFTPLFKRRIRKRDNQVCMVCGIHSEKLSRALDVHHINYDKTKTTPQNCISLCRLCHLKTQRNRTYWTKFFESMLRDMYGYDYSNNPQMIVKINNGEILNEK